MTKELTYEEFLQDSTIYKIFGFRTLKTTGCLACKYTSRVLEHNLHLDVPLIIDDKEFHKMSAKSADSFFNDENTLLIEEVLQKEELLNSSYLLKTI